MIHDQTVEIGCTFIEFHVECRLSIIGRKKVYVCHFLSVALFANTVRLTHLSNVRLLLCTARARLILCAYVSTACLHAPCRALPTCMRLCACCLYNCVCIHHQPVCMCVCVDPAAPASRQAGAADGLCVWGLDRGGGRDRGAGAGRGEAGRLGSEIGPIYRGRHAAPPQQLMFTPRRLPLAVYPSPLTPVPPASRR